MKNDSSYLLYVRVVFAHRKKTQLPDEIISKKYVMAADVFEFGPLLVGKSRDKY